MAHIKLGLSDPPAANPALSSAAAAAAAAAGGVSAADMEKVWAAYEQKVAAAKAYDELGMDIQPIPGIVFKCFLKLNRKKKPTSNPDGEDAQSDLEALLAESASQAAASAPSTTTTSVHGIDAVPADKVDPSQRVKLFLNLCACNVCECVLGDVSDRWPLFIFAVWLIDVTVDSSTRTARQLFPLLLFLFLFLFL
jgi:hypothetical protein